MKKMIPQVCLSGSSAGTPHTARAPVVPTLVACVLFLSGCGPGRPARIVPPALDPSAVTAAILAKADANNDGVLTASERTAIPALATVAAQLDADRDGRLSQEELRGWLESVRDSKVAITSFTAIVTHLGKPLANVAVKLVPEPFMGPEMRAAEGVTDASGAASVTIPGSKYPGVNCGLYRVEITGRGNGGQMLPPHYNTKTELGTAVGNMLPENGIAHFGLD